jgi:hypothetical protein
MNVKMGGHTFVNVEVPLLWGTRAVLQDRIGRISIIDLSEDSALTEIVEDAPAPNIPYETEDGGYTILARDTPLYTFSPAEKLLVSLSLDLPDCQITLNQTRIGTNLFQNNMIRGSQVGIFVTPNSMGIGAPLPANLAALVE